MLTVEVQRFIGPVLKVVTLIERKDFFLHGLFLRVSSLSSIFAQKLPSGTLLIFRVLIDYK